MGLFAACFGCIQKEPGKFLKKKPTIFWKLLDTCYRPQLAQETPELKMAGE